MSIVHKIGKNLTLQGCHTVANSRSQNALERRVSICAIRANYFKRTTCSIWSPSTGLRNLLVKAKWAAMPVGVTH